MNRYLRAMGLLAAVSFVLAALICGARLNGYSHREHPLGLLGAEGVDGAALFNLAAFMIPGALMAIIAWMLRTRLPTTARWPSRIGYQLTMLSGLAFAAQGVLPLDPTDIGSEANGLHALAWTAWWLSFLSGAVLLASGRPARGAFWTTIVAALAVMVFALVPWPGAMAAFAPRLAFLAWLSWGAIAPRGYPLDVAAKR